MPFKLNQDRGHRSLKQKGGAIHSAADDAALRQRGNLTVWVIEEVVAAWKAASVVLFPADDAYDQDSVSATLAERHPEATIIVPPRSTAMPNEMAETTPTQPDRFLECVEPRGSPHIAKHGPTARQTVSGDTTRVRAEAAIGRFNQVIGDGLRSRTDQRWAAEMESAVHVLNRMLNLGRPNSTRIASLESGLG